MREQIKSPENSEKYILPEENIIELDENSEIRRRNKNYYRSLEDQGIDWPVEIQGGGRSWFNKKQFEVAYPVGDIFLASSVTFHELGHLRQGEVDQRFVGEELGSPNPKGSGETAGHDESEQDAWQRGLARVEKYCPEYFQYLEEKFQQYKKQGKFSQFKNFKEFYEHIVKVSLRITNFNDKYEDDEKLTDKKDKGRTLGKMIKADKLTNDFFTHQEAWRCGEKVDRALVKQFIQKMAEKIAEEIY